MVATERAPLMGAASASGGHGGDVGAGMATTEEDEGSTRVLTPRRHRWVLTMVMVVVSMTLLSTLAYMDPSGMLSIQRGGAMTAREYGPTLVTLAWDSTRGFTLRVPKAFRHPHARVVGGRDFITSAIERYYPSRIAPGSPPFHVFFEVDDSPVTPCMGRRGSSRCHAESWEPIFAFGSSPKDSRVMPSMRSATLIALGSCISPLATVSPSGNMTVTKDTEPLCGFFEYPERVEDMSACDGAGARAITCRYYGLFNMDAMVNKEEYKWDNLIKKAIWRGSDYHFYQRGNPGAKPEATRFIGQIGASRDKKAAMEALLAGSAIGPRLRAVLMSQLNPNLIDAKFFNWDDKRHPGLDLGLVTKDHIEENVMGTYKYQLDLGGGGGTTWSGVIPKLSMPGVLFHHETAMKDSYFDQLKPYVHYLPLKEDLSNFEELVRFVETNATEAQAISQRASDWVREFRKLGSLLRHNYEVLAVPLAKSLDPTGELKLEPIPFERAHPELA